MEAVRRFHAAGVRVIDLSADFRLKDIAVYERWYGVEHTAPALCAEARYGLCELYRSQLAGAQLIANPGCYPTSVNLGLYPLAKAGWLGERVIIDSMSGVSGAGRKTNLTYQFVEANENITPYNVGHRHRHIAEMEQVLGATNGSGAATDSFHAPSCAGQPGHPEHDVRGRAGRRDGGAYPRTLRGELRRRAVYPSFGPGRAGQPGAHGRHKPLCHRNHGGGPVAAGMGVSLSLRPRSTILLKAAAGRRCRTTISPWGWTRPRGWLSELW